MNLDDVRNLGKVKCPHCGKMVKPQSINKFVVVCPECRCKI
jgi:endogenous inhibitor of DNA gyrase (YacG/DUF329 family)